MFYSRWWFETFFMFTLTWEMIQFNYYFSDGLKPPTSVALGFLRHRHTSVFTSAQAYLQAYQPCLNHPCFFEKTRVQHNGEIDGGEGNVCPTSSAKRWQKMSGKHYPPCDPRDQFGPFLRIFRICIKCQECRKGWSRNWVVRCALMGPVHGHAICRCHGQSFLGKDLAISAPKAAIAC